MIEEPPLPRDTTEGAYLGYERKPLNYTFIIIIGVIDIIGFIYLAIIK